VGTRDRSRRLLRHIVVVASRLMDTVAVSAALPREPRDDLEVFLLYLVGRRTVPAWSRRRRFWRSRHAELDQALAEMTWSGALTDGIATTDEPVDALERTLESVEPDEVVVVATHDHRLDRDSLRRLVERRQRASGRTLSTRWIST
jgi:xanthine/CO dehydrogenase XdhC/CoxF family maturation factor